MIKQIWKKLENALTEKLPSAQVDESMSLHFK